MTDSARAMPMDIASVAAANRPGFPPLPGGLLDAHGIQGLRWCPFGSDEKGLAIDLSGVPDPSLITQVLAHCGRGTQGGSVPPDLLWDMELGWRVLALLHVAAAQGLSAMEVPLACPATDCAASIGVELTVTELTELVLERSGQPLRVPLDDGVLVLRRPTGKDQLDWSLRTYGSAREAVEQMIQRLRLAGPRRPLLDPEIRQVEAALEEQDPLVAFRVDARCPECGRLAGHPVDLVGIVMRTLRWSQAALIESIHRLARRYHWSEAEIAALPAWRRDRYLALLEREEGG